MIIFTIYRDCKIRVVMRTLHIQWMKHTSCFNAIAVESTNSKLSEYTSIEPIVNLKFVQWNHRC